MGSSQLVATYSAPAVVRVDCACEADALRALALDGLRLACAAQDQGPALPATQSTQPPVFFSWQPLTVRACMHACMRARGWRGWRGMEGRGACMHGLGRMHACAVLPARLVAWHWAIAAGGSWGVPSWWVGLRARWPHAYMYARLAQGRELVAPCGSAVHCTHGVVRAQVRLLRGPDAAHSLAGMQAQEQARNGKARVINAGASVRRVSRQRRRAALAAEAVQSLPCHVVMHGCLSWKGGMLRACCAVVGMMLMP